MKIFIKGNDLFHTEGNKWHSMFFWLICKKYNLKKKIYIIDNQQSFYLSKQIFFDDLTLQLENLKNNLHDLERFNARKLQYNLYCLNFLYSDSESRIQTKSLE